MGDNISVLKCGLKCVWDPSVAELPDPSSPPSLGARGSFVPDVSRGKLKPPDLAASPAHPAPAALGWWGGSSPPAPVWTCSCCSQAHGYLKAGLWPQLLKMPNIVSCHSLCAASASNIPALGWAHLMFTLACRLSHHLSGNVYYLLTQVWVLNLVSENRIIYQP